MANSKISALTSATTPLAGTETLPVVQSSTTKQVSVANLTAGRSVATGPLTVTGTTDLNGDVGILGATPGIYPRVTNTDLFLSMRGTGNLVVQNTSGVEKATFLANGDVRVAAGNVIIATSGKGINFTANTPAAGMTSQLLNWYDEGAWTPVPTSLTVVGTPTYTGKWTRIGREVFIHLTVKSTTSTASTANTTYFSGLPYAVGLGSTVSAVNNATVTSLGIGLIDTSNVIYTPSWTSGANQTITLSGFYYV